MKLNCKPGDMAIIVGTGPRTRHLLGRIVTVTSLSPYSCASDPAWLHEPKLYRDDGGPIHACEDRFLRPLNDQADANKTLCIAGLPALRETTT